MANHIMSLGNTKQILVIAAHPDDEILGCGGTIARHVENGDNVDILFLADGVTSRGGVQDNKDIIEREANGEKACSILGANVIKFAKYPDNKMDTIPFLDVVNEIEMVIKQLKPVVIYTHHVGDLNIDHQITHKAVMTAARPQPGCVVREIYSFEVLSSTEWSTPSPASFFIPNRFVDISMTLSKKLFALKSYNCEMHEFPHSRSVESVSILARHRGAAMGMDAAEAFKVERILD